ncbi:hypothetical protein FRC06_002015, partial [Ceratobasidium sp. 370]
MPTPHTAQGDGVSDVEMAGIRPEPATRYPSVTIEEIPDQSYLQTQRPIPAHRSPSVTIEEIPMCPHPFAKPTRQSLYSEPHPDITAGQASWFEAIAELPPPLYDTSLTDPDTFREAYWLRKLPISEDMADEYFKLPHTCNWYWKNMRQFDAEIDSLPHGPDWYRQTIRVPGDNGEEVVDLWKQNVIEIVAMLLRNRRFMQYMRFALEKHWESEDHRGRVYDEMWSGNWWWRIQNILGSGATIAPIILAVDKTQMTVLSGNKQAWPVYLSIGNISKEIRRKPSERATLLVGYIPVVSLSDISDKTKRSETSWQLFHTCMESILEPLKEASRKGVEMFCADGGVHRVHPILAAYIADYPEQCLVTCVRDNRCPICWVPGDKRADYGQHYELRGKQTTLHALHDHWAGHSQSVHILGIRPNRPFWADLPYVDISNCIAPDILHQLNKGMFRDHVVKWCRSILGKSEVDRRIKGMPRFAGLHHFAQGISVVKQWTGSEAKTLAKIFLPTLAGCSKPEAAAAARNLLDFIYYAHMPELSDADLEELDSYLANFHDLKDIFVGTDEERNKMKDLLDSDERFHGIPKLHMLSHYVHFIHELGTPDGYNTEVPERLHIDYVKVPWRASNHVNPTEQMATYLQRMEAWAFLRAYLHDTGVLLDSRFAEIESQEDEDAEDQSDEVLGEDGDDSKDRGDGEDKVWYPKPTISIAKRPSIGKKSVAYLMDKHGACDLIPATTRFLHELPNTGLASDIPLSAGDTFCVWTRCRLNHNRLPFLPSVDPQIDRIRTVPRLVDSEGRLKRFGAFDVVLFSLDDPDSR